MNIVARRAHALTVPCAAATLAAMTFDGLRLRRSAPVALVGALIIAIVACGGGSNSELSLSGATSSSGSGACTAYQVPATTDLTTPIVGFETEVIPILQRNCSYGECHGQAVEPILGFYGGDGDGGELDNGPTAAQIRSNLVGQPSQILPTMKLVTAGSTATSFMMHVMDGDHCLYAAQCKGGNCGAQMPNDRPVLSVEERDYVRRWIAQGAK